MKVDTGAGLEAVVFRSICENVFFCQIKIMYAQGAIELLSMLINEIWGKKKNSPLIQ